jgi:hypothetical protein
MPDGGHGLSAIDERQTFLGMEYDALQSRLRQGIG